MSDNSPATLDEKMDKHTFNTDQVLVGLEMNAADENLLKYLNFLAEHVKIQSPNFIHVLPKYTSIDPFFEWEGQDFFGDYALESEVKEKLQSTVKSLFGVGKNLDPSFRVSHGNPLEEILRADEELKPGLLIIGKQSNANYHSILAKNLIRKSNSDVLIIPTNSKDILNNILVPVDFSENSGRALQAAVELNKKLDIKARIICMHVYELPDVNTYRISRTFGQFEKMILDNIEDAFKVFLDTYIPNDKMYIDISFMKKDMPGYGGYIMKYAKENNVDFIVMGTMGHSKAHLLFLGSTTEKLISLNEDIPTLVVK